LYGGTGQREGYAGSPAALALKIDLASLCFDSVTAEVQAQPAADRNPFVVRFDTDKVVKDPLLLPVRDTCSLVRG
jgi:hypothetical protein